MRILFMGTASFAVPSLEALLKSGHQVIGVVTQPDRPAGRGRKARISPVKQVALDAGIAVYQPEKVRAAEFIETVRELAPDLNVVAAFGQIIPKALLDIPPNGNINVHASLLPKYRGAAPVHYALFNGEKYTGVTTMLMDPGLDTGPILLQKQVEILPGDTEGVLEERLAKTGADLLIETLDALCKGELTPVPQENSFSSYAPSVKREECGVDWSNNAEMIVNRIRGCTPRPGAYTHLQDTYLKVWASRVISDDVKGQPGEILDITPEGIDVQAGEGIVRLMEVQPANRNRMQAIEFARGYKVSKGMRLITLDL